MSLALCVPLLSHAFEQEHDVQKDLQNDLQNDVQSDVQSDVQLARLCNMTEMITPIINLLPTQCVPREMIVMPSRIKQLCLQVIDLYCNVMPYANDSLISFTGEHAGISWVLHEFTTTNNETHGLLSLMKPYSK